MRWRWKSQSKVGTTVRWVMNSKRVQGAKEGVKKDGDSQRQQRRSLSLSTILGHSSTGTSSNTTALVLSIDGHTYTVVRTEVPWTSWTFPNGVQFALDDRHHWLLYFSGLLPYGCLPARPVVPYQSQPRLYCCPRLSGVASTRNLFSEALFSTSVRGAWNALSANGDRLEGLYANINGTCPHAIA